MNWMRQIQEGNKSGSKNAPLWRRFAHSARDLVLPSSCLACERTVNVQGVVCAECWPDLRFIERPFCSVLGSPFTYDLGENALSARAIANPPPFDRARSVVLYDDIARKLVQGLKFGDRTDLAPWMAKWMVRHDDGLLQDGALVVPVPLHRFRLFQRRFNQSAELARTIAKDSGLRYAPEALVRIRSTKQQVGLGQKERAKNVQGAFRVPTEEAPLLKGRHVVLIDDVFTTGATLEACTRALRRAGVSKIDCLTFARVANGVAVTDI